MGQSAKGITVEGNIAPEGYHFDLATAFEEDVLYLQ
jgi:hypothetical protein